MDLNASIQTLRRACAALRCAAVLCLFAAIQPALADTFTKTNLVSDIPGLANFQDPNLRNPWGMAFGPTSPFWISDQATGVATLYNAGGGQLPLVVTIPPVFGGSLHGNPTGVVFNGTSNFVLNNGKPAVFIFATLDGTIAAWNSGTSATTAVFNPGAAYTGLALASNGGANYLYAASAAGFIKVFDSNFNDVTGTTFAGKFVDPTLPHGFVPYNIQLVGNQLYVEYAEIGPFGIITGPGLGFVNVYDTAGNFVRRLVSNGPLDAPWGVTLAPANFGSFSNDLLIGNNGNGEINAFDPTSGAFLGVLDGTNGNPIVNSGLWALNFNANDPGELFLTAGINGQRDGLFAEISPSTVPEPGTIALLVSGVLGLIGVRHKRRWNPKSAPRAHFLASVKSPHK
jgi:uncharacterized protein (TIGR03118 family)